MEWEITGDHFKYLVGGYFFNTPELKNQFQLMSKVHCKHTKPQIMMNRNGHFLGVFEPASAVFPVDWSGGLPRIGICFSCFNVLGNGKKC